MPVGPGGIKAGKAFVIIEAIDQTGKVLNGIRNRIGQFASQMSNMGQMLALRAAAALTPVAFSLSTYQQFDDAMRKVGARSRGTGHEMQNLRKQAKELGRTTAFTATHIANLQARLAQFGMNRGDIEKTVKPLMLLARAGGEGLDLGTDILQATDAVTQTMSAWHLESSQAAEVSDILTVALNDSKFTLEELSTALQHAAPTAALFKMSIKDTVAVLSTIRELGYDASIVGTAFRNMWLRASRSKGRDDFNKRLEDLTGKTIEFVDASGNLRNPIEILQQLRGALQGVGNVEAADMIAKLMELRATGPSLGLMGATDTLARMLTVLDDTGGAAQRIHDEMESGIGGAFRNFESAVEGVQIAVGEALDRMVQGMSGFSQQYLQSITAWIEANGGYIAIVTAAIAAIGAFGIALIVLGQIVIASTAILGVATAAIGFFVTAITTIISLSPAGLITLAVGLTAIAAAYLLLSQINWGNIIAGTTGSMNAIAQALKGGDILAAWEILVMRMKLTFMKFVLEIMKEVENLAHWILALSKIGLLGPIATAAAVGGELGAAKHGMTLSDLVDMPRKAIETGVSAMEAKMSELELRETRKQQLRDMAAAQGGRSRAEPDISAWMNKLNDMAKNLSPIAMKPQGGVAPGIVEGLRIGTQEAAQAIQEAMFNQEQKNDTKRAADAAEDSLDELVQMNSKLDSLAVGAV
jgi:TP901 family phage tail tape measure protein